MKNNRFFRNKFILILLVLAPVSCENGLDVGDIRDITKARLSVSVNETMNSTRTILPLDVDKENMAYSLFGTVSDGTEEEIKSWETYSAMTEDTEILVDTGDWTFTLTASKNNTALYSSILTQTINAGNNTLDFTLKEVSSALTSGEGSANVTLTFPSDVDVASVKAALLNLSEGTEISDFGYESLNINSITSGENSEKKIHGLQKKTKSQAESICCVSAFLEMMVAKSLPTTAN